MESNLISVNVPNFVTVSLMAFVGLAVAGMAAAWFQNRT